ncbi:uncharacterized protein ACNS7B_012356 isoform 1-T1 [Menidia menidia]
MFVTAACDEGNDKSSETHLAVSASNADAASERFPERVRNRARLDKGGPRTERAGRSSSFWHIQAPQADEVLHTPPSHVHPFEPFAPPCKGKKQSMLIRHHRQESS